jgi:hypothetical protein
VLSGVLVGVPNAVGVLVLRAVPMGVCDGVLEGMGV